MPSVRRNLSKQQKKTLFVDPLDLAGEEDEKLGAAPREELTRDVGEKPQKLLRLYTKAILLP